MTSSESGDDYSVESETDEEDMFEGLSPEKIELIKERMHAAQEQFKVFNKNQKNQKFEDVQKMYPQLNEKAINLALESCNNNEMLLFRRFRDEGGYLDRIIGMSTGRIPIDMDVIRYVDPKKLKQQQEESSTTSGDENEDWRDVPRQSKKRKQSSVESSDDKDFQDYLQPHSKRRIPRVRLNEAMSHLEALNTKKKTKSKRSSKDDDFSSDDEPVEFNQTNYRSTRGMDLVSRVNVTTKQLIDLGWSDARIKAFKNRFQRPNQYYYRFNDPGEKQATGKWSPHDRFLFLKQLIEFGVDYSWGLFSMKIPGRVGYQCSNYYRQLIREGVVIDDNYFIDQNNKLTFKFKSKMAPQSKKKKGSKKFHELSDLDDLELDNIDFDQMEEKNCLPGFIDVMTMEEVVKPAISPYGHVLGYDTWTKVLNREPKNTCPFTKKKLNRRQLEKLTFANIDKYRDKIVDMSSHAGKF